MAIRLYRAYSPGTRSKSVSYFDDLSNVKPTKALTFGKKVFIDSKGFRIPNHNYKYNNSGPSILILGDSTTFGVGVEEEKSFTGLLRYHKKDINFYNASVIGHSLRDYASLIKKEKNLKFNKILIFLNINDISTEINADNKKKNYLTFIEKIKKNIVLSKVNIFFRAADRS